MINCVNSCIQKKVVEKALSCTVENDTWLEIIGVIIFVLIIKVLFLFSSSMINNFALMNRSFMAKIIYVRNGGVYILARKIYRLSNGAFQCMM